MLQCEVPKVHVMMKMITSFVRRLLGRCVTPEVLVDADLTSVGVDDKDNLLPSDKVMIGYLTQSTMTANDFLMPSTVNFSWLKHTSILCLTYLSMTLCCSMQKSYSSIATTL